MPKEFRTEQPTTAGQATYLQASLDVRGRRCLVVGGGAVAVRKTTTLLEAGAAVTLVAPELSAIPEGADVKQRRFRDEDLEGVLLVVAATDDRELNARIGDAARSRRIWANVADDPEASTFVFPALVSRGPLRIAISTSNGSPALARRIRQRLESEFGPEYGQLTALLARLRTEWEPCVAAAGVAPAIRNQAWHAVLDEPLTEMLRDGRAEEAEEAARRVLRSYLETDTVP